ncbi:MAG: Na(+)-translocating NADH-quinone reductase subunit C [Enterovibrio sp.]
MSNNNDSIKKTLGVVIGLSLVCSVVVSVSAVSLRPLQQKNAVLDVQSNILSVAGIEARPRDVLDLFQKRIEPRLINLKTGEFVTNLDAQKFDQRAAAKDPKLSTKISPSDDIAKLGRIPNIAKIYFVKDEKGNVSEIILPMNGKGLWSMMYSFVALKMDGNTVNGVAYYEHGETPGLGGEVENPVWRQKWVGKQLFDAQGNPALHVVKGGAKPDDIHGVDGLSGATLTAKGVQNTLRFWLGENGFGPFLKKVHKGEQLNG